MDASVRQHLHAATIRTLHANQFTRTSSNAAHTLTDIVQRYITLLALTSKQYAEHSGRDGGGVNVHDVVAAMAELGVGVNELMEFAEGLEGKEMQKYSLTEGAAVEEAKSVEPANGDDENAFASTSSAARRLDSLADIKCEPQSQWRKLLNRGLHSHFQPRSTMVSHMILPMRFCSNTAVCLPLLQSASELAHPPPPLLGPQLRLCLILRPLRSLRGSAARTRGKDGPSNHSPERTGSTIIKMASALRLRRSPSHIHHLQCPIPHTHHREVPRGKEPGMLRGHHQITYQNSCPLSPAKHKARAARRTNHRWLPIQLDEHPSPSVPRQRLAPLTPSRSLTTNPLSHLNGMCP